MSDEQRQPFPENWQIGKDFDPNNHIMQLKGKDYIDVQHRLLWFIRDQRALIVAGLATMPYVVKTDLVELDRERGWAHFLTYVRDVLGNEATMFGSESAKDFGDYIEKASTKSLGRALLALGYGTAFAPEISEGDRVVDSPTDRRGATSRQAQNGHARRETPRDERRATTDAPAQSGEEPAASEKQLSAIRKLCEALGKPLPPDGLTYAQARELLPRLSAEYQQARSSEAGQPQPRPQAPLIPDEPPARSAALSPIEAGPQVPDNILSVKAWATRDLEMPSEQWGAIWHAAPNDLPAIIERCRGWAQGQRTLADVPQAAGRI